MAAAARVEIETTTTMAVPVVVVAAAEIHWSEKVDWGKTTQTKVK